MHKHTRTYKQIQNIQKHKKIQNIQHLQNIQNIQNILLDRRNQKMLHTTRTNDKPTKRIPKTQRPRSMGQRKRKSIHRKTQKPLGDKKQNLRMEKKRTHNP